MVTQVDTAALRRLLDGEAPAGPVQLVEVLDPDEYAEEHLPGAVNVPYADLTADGLAHLDPPLDLARPIVVYGFDHECDRSARAAVRLEVLGFTDVSDYVPGKVAWLAEGLPAEGARRPEQRVGAVADPDVPLVPGDATVAEAAALVGDADIGVVVDADRVVLGVLRPETFGLPDSTPVADVLQPGPSTFRPSMTIAELVGYFRDSDEHRALVTTHAGRWIGLIRREDVLDD